MRYCSILALACAVLRYWYLPPPPPPYAPLQQALIRKKGHQISDLSVLDVILFLNKKTPEGVYAGCVGVRKNYRYVEWQWKVE